MNRVKGKTNSKSPNQSWSARNSRLTVLLVIIFIWLIISMVVNRAIGLYI